MKSAPTETRTPQPKRPRKWMPVLLSFAVGLFAGVVFHYVLYRLSIPAKPFIYVAF